MKTIKIWYVDFNPKNDTTLFTKILEEKYKIVLDKENPDFVICSSYGSNYLNYDCPRVIITDGNIAPDFNLYDYAISPQKIFFGDRHYKCLFPMFSDLKKALDDVDLKNYIFKIFDQENRSALRRSSAFTMWGRVYEQRHKKWSKIESKSWFALIRPFYRNL